MSADHVLSARAGLAEGRVRLSGEEQIAFLSASKERTEALITAPRGWEVASLYRRRRTVHM